MRALFSMAECFRLRAFSPREAAGLPERGLSPRLRVPFLIYVDQILKTWTKQNVDQKRGLFWKRWLKTWTKQNVDQKRGLFWKRWLNLFEQNYSK